MDTCLIGVALSILLLMFVIVYCTVRVEKSEHITDIDVLCLTRDNGKYIEYLGGLVKQMKHAYPHHRMQFYFFENNSKDDTVHQIDKFLLKNDGVRFTEDFSDDPFAKWDVSSRRTFHMSMLRRLFKEKLGPLRSKYVVALDTDLVFHEDTIDKMIKTIEKDDTIGMVTPFTVCSHMPHHYFDTLALKINGESYFPNCPFTTCSSCNRQPRIEPSGLIQVDSAFNALCLMRTDVYNKCDYVVRDGDRSEHDSFNEQYKASGKRIVIDSNIRLVMQIDGF